MRPSFEIPGVGRAWLVLLDGAEAWFSRGLNGYLLGPYPDSADAGEALIEDHRLFQARQRRKNADDVTDRAPEFIFPYAAELVDWVGGVEEWVPWYVRLRPTPNIISGFYVFQNSAGVLKKVRALDPAPVISYLKKRAARAS